MTGASVPQLVCRALLVSFALVIVPHRAFGQSAPKTNDLRSISVTKVLLGALVTSTFGHFGAEERLASSGELFNKFSDTKGGLTVKGLAASIMLGQRDRAVGLGAYASMRFGGSQISDAAGLAVMSSMRFSTGARVAMQGLGVSRALTAYLSSGVGWLKQDLSLDFKGPITSSSATVPGFMIGGGMSFQPAAVQVLGCPLSIFGEVEHASWKTADLKAPISAPSFNYTFARSDWAVQFGVALQVFGSGR